MLRIYYELGLRYLLWTYTVHVEAGIDEKYKFFTRVKCNKIGALFWLYIVRI